MLSRLTLAVLVSLLTLPALAQLSGSVKNELGIPLEGATIILGSQKHSTITLHDGSFTLANIKDGTYSLWVSHLGYESLDSLIDIQGKVKVDIVLHLKRIHTEEVIVKAHRADEKDPVPSSLIDESDIQDYNGIQDLPYLLSKLPSVVTTSDGGTGVGYSGLRIRGTDPSRINVMINGIPYNDSESHDVYWVDIPDIVASTQSIQVQRGVGTSTQGAAAFGANINIQSLAFHTKPYAEINTSAGSFNTFKSSLSAGTGLLNDHFSLNVRTSFLHTDGYIDRAFADLRSTFISGGWFSKKSVIKFSFFTGHELTYQAWGGVPSEYLQSNRTYNPYTYENEVDDYTQRHVQVHWSYQLQDNLNINSAIHYTRGFGFYEQFRESQKLSDYLLDPVVFNDTIISRTDLVRQKWLDNNFGGAIFNLNYARKKVSISAGGGWNLYDGDHFGKVIWAQYFSNGQIPHKYYESKGLKEETNVFAKVNYDIFNRLSLYADIQFRYVNYSISGLDDDQRDITQKHHYPFLNPKAGVFYDISDHQKTWLSIGIANREPKRSNFTDAAPGQSVMPEKLTDLEFGYELIYPHWQGSVNLYYMRYENQLILTGEINDVGSAIMVNVPESYRRGLEWILGINPFPMVHIDLNATLSQNRILNFTEYVDDWDTWGQRVTELGTTDLAFSPSFIAGSSLAFTPWSFTTISWRSQYVGRQFIDNTTSVERMLDAYWINNLAIQVRLATKFVKEIRFHGEINNLFNTQYESNAWVYSYFYEGVRQKIDGYFPQAGRHFMAGFTLTF